MFYPTHALQHIDSACRFAVANRVAVNISADINLTFPQNNKLTTDLHMKFIHTEPHNANDNYNNYPVTLICQKNIKKINTGRFRMLLRYRADCDTVNTSTLFINLE